MCNMLLFHNEKKTNFIVVKVATLICLLHFKKLIIFKPFMNIKRLKGTIISIFGEYFVVYWVYNICYTQKGALNMIFCHLIFKNT